MGKVRRNPGVEPTKRSRLTAKRKAVILSTFTACHICGGEFQDGDVIDLDHVIPPELGGLDDETNLRPAHHNCHVMKTSSDMKAIAKARRIRKSLDGETRVKKKIPSRGFPKRRGF